MAGFDACAFCSCEPKTAFVSLNRGVMLHASKIICFSYSISRKASLVKCMVGKAKRS